MIAVVGAGAMGSALAVLFVRAGEEVALLGTGLDADAVAAVRGGGPHPALGVRIDVPCSPYGEWEGTVESAERVVVAVSSEGLGSVAAELALLARPDVVWIVATKGWDPQTLRTPSEVVAAEAPGSPVAVLAGPALAPELVAGAPTAMVCASSDPAVALDVASSLEAGGVRAATTTDVAGVEIGAAYKNVTAIAVGMCEGLAERRTEVVYVHHYANARAAVFARGLADMAALCTCRGGQLETILGLAGAGDLYVTCLGGRNGTFGRLLGAGESPEQAVAAVGSTVEGVASTASALAVARRHGVELTVAAAVDGVLKGERSPEAAIEALVRL